MANEVLIRFRVNGDEHTLGISPGATLLDVLREQLDLTGTKKGCGMGDCGSCTVLVDGNPVNSCLFLAVQADGCEIETVEGLGHGKTLHPLQKSFVKHGSLQCGYCTPGMLMSSKALVDRNENPDDDEIKEALSGHLCRCGTYPRIIEAIKNREQFADQDLDTEPTEAGAKEREQKRDHKVVSHGVTRYDGPDKVTGRAKYTADIKLSGMIYGKILGSPIPHGLIKKIDVSKAKALPGVLEVITGADVTDNYYGVSPARYDEQILAKDRVRYVGDEVAAVAAVDLRTAERAIELIEVEYEELPAVFDPDSALAPGAPVIHPENERYAGNVNTKVEWDFGDVDKAFAEAHHVRKQRFVGNRTYQSPIEPHAAIVRYEHHGGKLTVWSSTQTPHYLHQMMSRTLEIPMGDIRVIRPAVGGGFGAKAETTPLELCGAILSKATGRPIKMEYTREEMYLHFRGRHKQYMELEIAVDKQGKIMGVKSDILLDGGAYTSYGIITAYYAGSMVPTLYKIENYRYNGTRVFTNLPASGAFRGHGVPHPRYAFESLLEMIAEDLGIDSFEIRKINAMEPNYRTVNALDISSCEFKATLDAAEAKSEWQKKKGNMPEGKGIGVGCGGFVSGAGYPIYRSDFPHSNAVIRVHEDATGVSLHIAAAEIGQGSDTVLTQIAAEELGIPYRQVWMVDCDTVLAPLDLGSYSSRVTLMAGNAVKMAAANVKKQVFAAAGEWLGCDPHGLVAEDGEIYIKEYPSTRMSWAEAGRMAFAKNGPVVGTGHYRPPKNLGGGFKGSTVGTSPAYSFSTAVCEVTVDKETGYVTIDRFTDFSDAGTVINPVTFHGQVEGSIIMGIGEGLMEDTVIGEKGKVRNPNLHDYLIPTIYDLPAIHTGVVESYEPRGPFGAKEIGEGSMLPAVGAIANAIYDACGARITSLPITPEKILAAIKANEAEAK